jgi:hypothetical protein
MKNPDLLVSSGFNKKKENLLSSRLYGRHLNFTSSCIAARGVYRRLGITPYPEDTTYYMGFPLKCE